MSEATLGYAFGLEVRRRRLAMGLTQDQVGRLVGCTRSTINTIESGTLPRFVTTLRLAKDLKISIDELVKMAFEAEEEI